MRAPVATVIFDDLLLPEPTTPAEVDDIGISRLTRAMGAGDEAAWTELYQRYANRLFRYSLVITRGREDEARDAVQYTFIRAVRYCRPFDREIVLWNWLTRLARSAVIDERRKSTRYFGFLYRWFEEQSAMPNSNDAESRLLSILESEISRLPPEDRELIQNKYFAGHSVRELALSLDITEKAIESRLVRLRRQLKAAVIVNLQKKSDE